MSSLSEKAWFQSTLARLDLTRLELESLLASFITELAPHYQATLPRPNDSIRALFGRLARLSRLRQCRDGQKRPSRLKPVLN
eukprot:scaffold140173_cov56-Attheya_sp.AAC.1